MNRGATANYSERNGKHFFTDHITHMIKNVFHSDSNLIKNIDNTEIMKISWFYDHLGSYKHSFVVLYAKNCQENIPCVFVTEKDKLGV